MEFSGGWDSVATLVEGRWVERRPRRPEVAEQLLRETRVMPWLAPLLPLPVPVPVVVEADPLVVRHALVPGEPLTTPRADHGRVLGGFLRALHGSSASAAVRHGVAPAAATHRDRAAIAGRFRAQVVPRVPASYRDCADAVLADACELPADTVVHGDLGPEHILVADDRVSGVIDFGDLHLGDAANDLAWPLYGAPAEFAAAVAAAYEPTDDLRRRALLWHRLGPWHEVLHGLDTGDEAAVRSGLAGVIERLALGVR
ncbi:phosphotransferase family protein [Nocardia farcinica]|uniref:phosphotransferase family protein n=1 Tax=Nocardia farcinica TaxID=37329 RepID=UPI0037AD5229